MKKIIIQFDYTDDKGISYMEVLKNIGKQTPLIHTNCLDFFDFFYLNKGYDVEVRKSNGDNIILSELLEDEKHVYTRRNIRKAHDASRLLIANELRFKTSS